MRSSRRRRMLTWAAAAVLALAAGPALGCSRRGAVPSTPRSRRSLICGPTRSRAVNHNLISTSGLTQGRSDPDATLANRIGAGFIRSGDQRFDCNGTRVGAWRR